MTIHWVETVENIFQKSGAWQSEEEEARTPPSSLREKTWRAICSPSEGLPNVAPVLRVAHGDRWERSYETGN